MGQSQYRLQRHTERQRKRGKETQRQTETKTEAANGKNEAELMQVREKNKTKDLSRESQLLYCTPHLSVSLTRNKVKFSSLTGLKRCWWSCPLPLSLCSEDTKPNKVCPELGHLSLPGPSLLTQENMRKQGKYNFEMAALTRQPSFSQCPA